MRKLILAIVILVLVAIAIMLQPVCVPLSDDELKSFNVPVEQRTDRDLYLRVFQRKNDRWYQCKTRLSRFFFN